MHNRGHHVNSSYHKPGDQVAETIAVMPGWKTPMKWSTL